MHHLLPLISSPWIYLVVVVAVAVDGFLPVVPSETLVIGLGAMSATGSVHLNPPKSGVIGLGAADQVLVVESRVQ